MRADGKKSATGRPDTHHRAARNVGRAFREGKGGKKKSERKRQLILDAAAKIFRDKGYAGARMADIAAAAGTQAGSLYYHFKSREELVEEVLDRGVDSVRAAVSRAIADEPDDAPPLQLIAAAVRAHIVASLAQDDYASANARIFGQIPGDIRDRHLKKQRAYGDDWRRLIQMAREHRQIDADRDPSATRMLILGTLNWCAEWYRPGRLPAEQVGDLAADILLFGLAPRSSGEPQTGIESADRPPGEGVRIAEK